MDSQNPTPLRLDHALLLARQLRVFGIVLLVLYGANCLSDILPLQLLNPLWQIGVANSLVNNAGIAGTGVILLHLANYVDQDTGSALALRKTIAGLSTMAALGFLLLIPLQISAVTRGLLNVRVSLAQQVKSIDQQANRFRTEISNAATAPELEARMVAISGPVPGPEDLRRPLPELKQSLLKLVDLESTRLKGNISSVSLRDETWALAEQTLRLSISALALALGFGVLAQHDVAFPTPVIRLVHWIRRMPKAYKAKQRENQEKILAQQAMKRHRTNMELLSKHSQRLAREAQRKEEGSLIEKVEKFLNRASGQNRKGPPRL
ncbi:hypothetical protein NZK32_13810 [Cyanobium sp. FGCU-52]|nr:hypothetical protein [Cyanobium sp. FGCU52]